MFSERKPSRSPDLRSLRIGAPSRTVCPMAMRLFSPLTVMAVVPDLHRFPFSPALRRTLGIADLFTVSVYNKFPRLSSLCLLYKGVGRILRRKKRRRAENPRGGVRIYGCRAAFTRAFFRTARPLRAELPVRRAPLCAAFSRAGQAARLICTPKVRHFWRCIFL